MAGCGYGGSHMDAPNTLDRLGDRIAETRTRAGLTVSDLARRVGCSHSALWGIEAGRSMPSLQLAVRIAQALEVPLDDLTRGDR